jgi:hypothetical protein
MPEKTVSEQITEIILQTKAKFPELRVGQIIANAMRRITKLNCDPYFVSDEDLLKGLKEMFESYERV